MLSFRSMHSPYVQLYRSDTVTIHRKNTEQKPPYVYYRMFHYSNSGALLHQIYLRWKKFNMVRMVMHTKTKDTFVLQHRALFSDLSVSGHLKYICFQFSLDKMDPRDGSVLRGMRSSKHASKMDPGYNAGFPCSPDFSHGKRKTEICVYLKHD